MSGVLKGAGEPEKAPRIEDEMPRIQDMEVGTNGVDEKKDLGGSGLEQDGGLDISEEIQKELNATASDLEQAKVIAAGMSVEDLFRTLESVHTIHLKDPNFPNSVLTRIGDFLENEDIRTNPAGHQRSIDEMKLEAALITNNSPYSEVRAVVENTDQVELPQLTFRVWFMGLIFCACKAGVNQLFSVRSPPISIDLIVFQVLAYPLGRLMAAVLPEWGFYLFGRHYSLNPGPFNFKEHMLVVIFVGCGSAPYTDYIIWVQALPQFFNQPWANDLTYQMTIGLSSQFIGYGLAGLCRPFLVWPSYCVWPTNLVNMAVNKAFHSDSNESVMGPFKKVFQMTRFRFFLWTTLAMFVYTWIPSFLFMALQSFSWIEWINPTSVWVKAIAGMDYGLGWNPIPTFDWSVVNSQVYPLVYPWFTTVNLFIGASVSSFVILGMWATNAFYTGYFPITTPMTFDRFAQPFQVANIIDDKGLFDEAKFQQYSPAYMSAAYVQLYMFFFAEYTAILVHTVLCHGRELKLGFKSLLGTLPFFRKKEGASDPSQYQDIHNRLMKVYPEVKGRWYFLVLCISIGLGCWGIAAYPTGTPVWVVFYGIAMSCIFLIPTGLMAAMTGTNVTMNVLAEFIGGCIVPGNALAMNFFKTYGYVTAAHAIVFSSDLKLGHYVKLAPWNTFIVQMAGTFVYSVVTIMVLRWQLTLEDICNPDITVAPLRMICNGPRIFFTASIFWGTLGPKRIWGPGGQYTVTLVGFAVGAVLPFIVYGIQKLYPKQSWPRQLHPLVFLMGFTFWSSQGMSYIWPAVPVAFVSWIIVKKRYLAMWSKFNYILQAGFSCGMAVATLVIFFALVMNNVYIDWPGNNIISRPMGYLYSRLTLEEGEHFGPGLGEF